MADSSGSSEQQQETRKPNVQEYIMENKYDATLLAIRLTSS